MFKAMRKKDKLISNDSNEKGFASLVISLVLILILALLTVGFAQLARREQQNALNKQLAIQANYAAESGINDAIQDINNQLITANSTPTSIKADSVNCMRPNLAIPASTNKRKIDPTTDVSFNCLLVDLKPPKLQYTNVTLAGKSQTFSNVDSNGNSSSLGSLTISWKGFSRTKAPSSCTSSPSSPSNCFQRFDQWNDGATSLTYYPAVLQVSLTPLGSGVTANADTVTVDRQQLLNNSFTVFAYPSNDGAGTVNFDLTQKGQIKNATCGLSIGQYLCSLAINNITCGSSACPPYEWYLIHILPYYDRSTQIQLSARSTAGATLNFKGQAVIDVTGRAKNTLKRLRVHVPMVCSTNCTVSPSSPVLPNFAIEGQDICKQFSTYPGSTTPQPVPNACP